MPQEAMAYRSEPYLIIELGWGQPRGEHPGFIPVLSLLPCPPSMHLGSPGSWLGTDCTLLSSGKSQQSRHAPTQKRTA